MTASGQTRAIADDIKEIYAEAKGNGFDTKVLRQIVRIRSRTMPSAWSRRRCSSSIWPWAWRRRRRRMRRSRRGSARIGSTFASRSSGHPIAFLAANLDPAARRLQL
jgi:hypothetical protein